ncbi:hypothetical protein ALDI51_14820 [Alicycliphilus denitrificans]|uniref:hypothetical protein n=1 Tax=Alicycliphilus denitrificans TaxID=179636 RepID=UPI000ACCE43A|nr:hypothetical protein [Alicycliphilus denitrificans]MBN9575056.1 hypothetical protein [Alicycliphilus denitrificans]BCN38163.1 hypothetical protein ALDI51_14820 [Alicycliphilus denitrificans]
MSGSTKHRGLAQRVEEPMASKLRLIAKALLELRVDGRASRLYLNEIADAINNGMLLAAIELSTTLLEIWVRDLLVIRKLTQRECKTKAQLHLALNQIDRETEGLTRGEMFPSMCRQLADLEVIDSKELEWLEATYKRVRTPFHHGVSGRIVDPGGEANEIVGRAQESARGAEILLAMIFGSAPHRRADSLETEIYSIAPALLAEITNFLAAHPIPRMGPARSRPSRSTSR